VPNSGEGEYLAAIDRVYLFASARPFRYRDMIDGLVLCNHVRPHGSCRSEAFQMDFPGHAARLRSTTCQSKGAQREEKSELRSLRTDGVVVDTDLRTGRDKQSESPIFTGTVRW
jgi:hypothetical protein